MTCHIQGHPNKFNIDVASETIEARRQRYNISKLLKEKEEENNRKNVF